MQKEYQWTRIAMHENELDFRSNGIAEVEHDGKKFCIARSGDDFFAFAHKCPHASGPMLYGELDGKGNVICPLHRYKFCMKNGYNVTGEGYYLRHWPVRKTDDGIFIGL